MALIEYIYIASQVFLYVGITTTVGVVILYIAASFAKPNNIVQGIGKMISFLLMIWLIEIALNISMLFIYK